MLKKLEGQTFRNGAQVEFRDVDYNLLTFEEQIQNDLDTDIMVRGSTYPHNAGDSAGKEARHISFMCCPPSSQMLTSCIASQVVQTSTRRRCDCVRGEPSYGARCLAILSCATIAQSRSMF